MNIAQLRESIVTLLSVSPNLIGSYTLPGGNKIAAVYVVGKQSVPREWKVEGLEVTIRQYPELLPRAGVGMADILQQWEVVLVQYTTNQDTLSVAMERMARRFPDATFRYLTSNDIGYERCRIIIPDREMKTILR